MAWSAAGAKSRSWTGALNRVWAAASIRIDEQKLFLALNCGASRVNGFRNRGVLNWLRQSTRTSEPNGDGARSKYSGDPYYSPRDG